MVFRVKIRLILFLILIACSVNALDENNLLAIYSDGGLGSNYTDTYNWTTNNGATLQGVCQNGNCYTYDGNDYMTGADFPTFSAYTMSLWLNLSVSDLEYIFFFDSQNSLCLNLASGDLLLQQHNGADWCVATSGSYGVGDSEFKNIIVRWDGSLIELFVDGVLAESVACGGMRDHSVSDTLGAEAGGGNALTGKIDEFYIWDVALDNASISDLQTTYYPFTAPLVLNYTTLTPTNGTNVNTDQTIQYDVTAGATPYTCRFYINASLTDTETYASTGVHSFNFTSGDWTQGINLINVTCNNSVSEVSGEKELFVDNVNPVISQMKMLQGSDNITFDINGSTIDENLIFRINVSDQNLYSFNISICHNTSDGSINFSNCEYTDKSVNISTATYVYNQSENLATFGDVGNHSFYIEACDAHTGEISILPVSYDGTKLDIDRLSITPMTASIVGMKTTEYYDRVSFTANLSKAENRIIFDIVSPEKLYQISRSGYKAHFVSGRNWIDFENDYYDVESIEMLTSNSARITLYSDTPPELIEFKSVGVINCVNYTLTAFIDPEGHNVTLSSPKVSFDATTKVNITFNYTPFFLPSSPENCTLNVNATEYNISYSITPNQVNSFKYEFSVPFAQMRNYYNVTVVCNDYHLHPPLYNENHEYTSNLLNFSIFNTATTTTTTSTTSATTTTEQLQITQDNSVQEFQTTAQGLFYIFLVVLWVVFLVLTLTKTGTHGRPIQMFNLFQILSGWVAGFQFLKFNWIIGIAILGCAVLVFIGKAFE